MNNTRENYKNRLREVDLYFNTLRIVDNGKCYIKSIDILGNIVEQEIDVTLSTMLKAHGFLLLYNLIEATIQNSIMAILNTIHASSITYKQLSDKLRQMWIKQELNSFDNDKVLSIIDKILNDEVLKFEARCFHVSGNIDAQKIREIMERIGGNRIVDGRELKTIKDNRNHLAHGEFSFVEIGQKYTVKDLFDYKESTQKYLDQVLKEIQDYVSNSNFKRP